MGKHSEDKQSAATSPKSPSKVLFNLDAITDADANKLFSLKSSIISVFISFRCQTYENQELKEENATLVERNTFLESELVNQEKYKDDAKVAIEQMNQYQKAYNDLKEKLAIEKAKFEQWTKSSKITENINRMQENQHSGIGSDGKYGKDSDKTPKLEASKSHLNNSKKVKIQSVHNTKVEKKLEKNVNVGFLTKRKLKKKIDNLQINKKRSRNGKEGVN